MINGALLDKLHGIRREHCTCGTVMIMPEFHEADCTYKPLGEAEIRKAEAAIDAEAEA